MTPQLVALALTLPWAAHPPQLQETRYRLDGWVLVRVHDRFTGGVSCTARSGALAIEGADLTVQFPRTVDTTDAAYRLDDGAAVLARDSLPTRALWRSRMSDNPLENPSGGALAIPLADVGRAQRLFMRIDTAHGLSKFTVGDVPKVLEKLAAIGCPPPR